MKKTTILLTFLLTSFLTADASEVVRYEPAKDQLTCKSQWDKNSVGGKLTLEYKHYMLIKPTRTEYSLKTYMDACQNGKVQQGGTVIK